MLSGGVSSRGCGTAFLEPPLEIAEQVQKRILDGGVTVPLGQFLQPMARRKGVTGNIESPITVFWNVEKK